MFIYNNKNKYDIMFILIPLGGKGERFSNAGYSEPKPLIKIFDKEIISYLLDNLIKSVDNSVDKIFIIYNQNLDNYNFKSLIHTHYPSVNLISLQHQTLGAAETINLGIHKIINSQINIDNTDCLLLDGDTFYNINILDPIRNLQKQYNAVLYFNEIYHEHSKPKYSYLSLDSSNCITDIKEKVRISSNANVGAYYFSSIQQLLDNTHYIIDNNIRFNNEYYTSCVIHHMLSTGHVFKGINLNSNDFICLGTPKQVTSYIDNTYAFLFDLDGTLVNSSDIYFKIWEELLLDFNISLTTSIFENYISGNNDVTFLKMLIPNIDSTSIDNISSKKDLLFIKYINHLVLIPGSFEFIQHIKYNGHKICIVTNCNRYIAETILSFFNLNQFIEHLILGNECSNPKPLPDPYIKALNLLNIPNNKAIIFEDSKSGMLSAKSVFPMSIVGIDSSNNHNNRKMLLDLGANIILKNFLNVSINNILFNNSPELDNLKKLVYDNLSYKYNIKDIIIQDNKLKGGFIADIVPIDIIIQSNESDESTLNCVVKLENDLNNSLKNMAKVLNLYDREYYFYENISPYINISIPHFYFIIKDSSFNSKGIILENLNNNNFILNLDLNTQSIDVSLTIIDKISKMHSKFWNINLQQSFDKLPKTNHSSLYPFMSNFVNENWQSFKIKWKNILYDRQIEIGDSIVSNFSQIQLYLSKDNLTLCHGDLKSPNIFYKKLSNNNYEPYFIDWQYINHGKGVSDIVFFIIESFSLQSIDNYTQLFKEYYYSKLSEYGVKNYSKQNFDKDFILSACFYPFFVAVWFGNISSEDLIDVNFPFFYIQKLFYFLEKNNCFISNNIFN